MKTKPKRFKSIHVQPALSQNKQLNYREARAIIARANSFFVQFCEFSQSFSFYFNGEHWFCLGLSLVLFRWLFRLFLRWLFFLLRLVLRLELVFLRVLCRGVLALSTPL